MASWQIWVVAVSALVGLAVLALKSVVRARANEALVVLGFGETRVSFGYAVVPFFLGHVEVLDLSAKAISIGRSGGDGYLTRDGKRAALETTVFVHVNMTIDDVLVVARGLGVEAANGGERVRVLLAPKVHEAIACAARKRTMAEIFDDVPAFRDEVVMDLSDSLSGLVVSDIAVHRVACVPARRLQLFEAAELDG